MFSSVQFSRSVVSNSLWPHGLQHARPPWPSSTPGVYSNSYPLSQSVIPFSSHLQSFPASGSFKESQFFQLEESFQWIFRTDFLEDGLVRSPCSTRDSQESSPIPQFKSINFSVLSFPYSPTLTSIHDYWKTTALTRHTFVDKVMSLLFNILSRLVITFLQGSKRLLISWLHWPSAVILEARIIKVCHCFHCFPIYLPWSDGTRCHYLSFLNVEL